MKKKKIISLIAAAVVLFMSAVTGIGLWEAKAATAATAATTAKLEVSSAKGQEGDTITVDVSVAENPGVCGLTFGLRYDKTVLSVKEVVIAGDIFSADDAVVQPNGDGYVGYTYAGLQDKTADGKLMTVTFQIKEGAAAADSTVAIGDVNGVMEASNFNGDTVELTTAAGKVTVQKKNEQINTGDARGHVALLLTACILSAGAALAAAKKKVRA